MPSCALLTSLIQLFCFGIGKDYNCFHVSLSCYCCWFLLFCFSTFFAYICICKILLGINANVPVALVQGSKCYCHCYLFLLLSLIFLSIGPAQLQQYHLFLSLQKTLTQRLIHIIRKREIYLFQGQVLGLYWRFVNGLATSSAINIASRYNKYSIQSPWSLAERKHISLHFLVFAFSE